MHSRSVSRRKLQQGTSGISRPTGGGFSLKKGLRFTDPTRSVNQIQVLTEVQTQVDKNDEGQSVELDEKPRSGEWRTTNAV